MIQPRTIVKVADNTGARTAQVIRAIHRAKHKAATIGNVVVVTIKSAQPNALIKKSDKVRGVIVRTRQPIKRSDGSLIRFDDNAIVLLNPDQSLRGTRVIGPVARELRERGYQKIISLAEETL